MSDQKYDRMDSEPIYGRSELLDRIMHELEQGCTIFGFDGVRGIGKSEVATRFGLFASQNDQRIFIRINVSDRPTEELLLAAVYAALQGASKTLSESASDVATAMLSRATGFGRRLLAGAIQDVMKKVNEHLEHTVEAITKEISGDSPEMETTDLLTKTNASNRRVFIKDFMAFFADMGHPVILMFDNYEDAEPSGEEFLSWLLGSKPEGWILIFTTNLEKLRPTDWRNRMSPTIQQNLGVVHRVDAPARTHIAKWFADVVHRIPTEDELDAAIAYTIRGRPVWLRIYLSALASGRELPRVPNLTALFTVRRASFEPASRSIAEILAFALPDAQVPRSWVEEVAGRLDVSHIGSAFDKLLAASEIVEENGTIAFYNSSYRDSWRNGLAEADLLKIGNAWYDFYRESVDAMLPIAGAGVLPELARRIAAYDDGANITRVARSLIRSDSVNTALAIVDASWQADGNMVSPGPDVIEHALIAAQARLDVGRYKEAYESLQMVHRHTGRDQQQAIRADLLGLKLALRQNLYNVVWRLSAKIEQEASDDQGVQLARELVVNTAYRDLGQRSEISASVSRIASLLTSALPGDRAKAERSLARSLAKLGRTEEAIDAAKSSLVLAEEIGDLREIANANLAMAESLRYSGALDEALDAYRQAEDLARGVGNRDCQIWSILGRACALVQRGDLNGADATLQTAAKVVEAPGFEHPLESAHVGMIHLVVSYLRGQTVDPGPTLSRYNEMGVNWPDSFVSAVVSTHSVSEPIPI